MEWNSHESILKELPFHHILRYVSISMLLFIILKRVKALLSLSIFGRFPKPILKYIASIKCHFKTNWAIKQRLVLQERSFQTLSGRYKINVRGNSHTNKNVRIYSMFFLKWNTLTQYNSKSTQDNQNPKIVPESTWLCIFSCKFFFLHIK